MNYCICYHGTNTEAAARISKTGFHPWSHFARKMNDAIAFGGNHVFSVRFEQSKMPDGGWQFHNRQIIPPSEIVSLEIVQEYQELEMYIFACLVFLLLACVWILGMCNRFLPVWACRIMFWHRPPREQGFDGCSFTGVCPRCGDKVLQDGQGNWFQEYSYLRYNVSLKGYNHGPTRNQRRQVKVRRFQC